MPQTSMTVRVAFLLGLLPGSLPGSGPVPVSALDLRAAAARVGAAAVQDPGPATVQGRVTDDATGAPLATVTVRVLGTDRSTMTDSAGRFRLARLQPGTRSLAFETLGYRSRVMRLTLAADELTVVNVALTSAPLALEGVVVTSQKRQQAVQEVPIAITVHDGGFLKSTGIGELDQLSAYTPGLEVQIQSPNNPGFVVRGITSDNGDARMESRVSVFQDGVSISKARGSVVELFDLERVEVLKGPQGTLFGRGAEIGAVHLIQNKARNERSARLTLGPGSYGDWFAEGSANAPWLEDRLFARVAGVYHTRQGYVENLAGSDLNGKETLALRGLLHWVPDALTGVDVIVNWQNDTPPGTAFKSGVFAPTGGTTAPWTPAFLGGDDRFEHPGVDRTVWGATVLADRDLSPAWTLQGIAAYRRFDSHEASDADGTSAPALQFTEDAWGDQYSAELRALYSSGGRLTGFLGGSAFHESAAQSIGFATDERSLYPLLTRVIRVQSDGAFPETPAVVDGRPNLVDSLPPNIVDLAPIFWPDDAGLYTTLLQGLVGTPLNPYHEEAFTNYGRNTAFELFADGTLKLTDRFHVTAGVRGTFEQLWSGIRVRQSDQPTLLGNLTGAAPNAVFPPTRDQERVHDQGTFLSAVGRLAVDFAVSEEMNLYGSVARGRRPPVIQEYETNPIANFEILPDEGVWSYEVGGKGFAAGRRLQYEVAAFYYDYRDFQTRANPELTGAGIAFDTDVGQATAYGGELSLVRRVSRALSLFGSYAYIEARFDDTGPTGQDQYLAGHTFRLTPKHSLAGGLGLRAPTPLGIAFLRPGYTWKSRVYFEEEWQQETFIEGEAPGLYQDAFGLLNVRAGITTTDGRATVELFGTNLLDADYIIDAGNTGLTFYAPTYIPGPPRLLGLRVTARF